MKIQEDDPYEENNLEEENMMVGDGSKPSSKTNILSKVKISEPEKNRNLEESNKVIKANQDNTKQENKEVEQKLIEEVITDLNYNLGLKKLNS